MKSQQEEQQLQRIEEELQQKDTTFEKELTKQLQEKKAQPVAAMEEVKYELELPALPKMSSKAKKEAKRIKTQNFGIETIRVPREGVYEINIEALLEKRPIIVLEKGKVYFIHLPSAFEKVRARE